MPPKTATATDLTYNPKASVMELFKLFLQKGLLIRTLAEVETETTSQNTSISFSLKLNC